jgi:ribose-phosphate pyrophosphokinase
MNLNSKGFPFTFPSGETQVRVYGGSDEILTIEKKVYNGDDILEILLTVDALRRAGSKKLRLVLPYVPYSRQDRVMVFGEALGIKVFADLINSCNFEEVVVFDPHSDVTPALINNCTVVSQESLLWDTCWPIPGDFTLVCPDAGARKKILKVAKVLKKKEIVYADKIRDVATGEITGTSIDFSWFNKDLSAPFSFLIVDDICDGGRTFIEIALAIRKTQLLQGSEYKLYLYVTHGFFSKGLTELSQYFSGIYVGNLMSKDPEVINNPLLTIRME